MIKFAAIAACTSDRVVGYQGQIPWHSPIDLKYFKKITENSILILGRKTLESLPGLLPKRIHLVVTSNANEVRSGSWYQTQLLRKGESELEKKIMFVTSLDEAKRVSAQLLNELPELQRTVYVAGGGQIYQQMLSYCQLVYLTLVTSSEKLKGDAYFPELEPSEWWLVEHSSMQDSDLGLEFRLYLAQGLKQDPAALELFHKATESLTS